MKKQWNYVEKDGNPKKAGLYWVTLIYPERKDGKKTGKFMAEVDTRYFADLDKESDLRGLTMDGEPDSGFAWTEECGSISGERRIDMDKSLYNASGCKDRTAHDAICAADRTRTLVYRASRTKKDEEAELFVKMVKRLAKGFGFKLCDRIKFEDPETGKKYV